VSAAAATFADGEVAEAGPGESFDDDDDDDDGTGASIKWVVRTAVDVGREVGPCGRPDGIAARERERLRCCWRAANRCA
jgi:hypothetical protein